MISPDEIIIFALSVPANDFRNIAFLNRHIPFCYFENAPADMLDFSKQRRIIFFVFQMPDIFCFSMQCHSIIGTHIAPGRLLIADMGFVIQGAAVTEQLFLFFLCQLRIAVIGVVAEGVHLQLFKAYQYFAHGAQQVNTAPCIMPLIFIQRLINFQCIIGVHFFTGCNGGTGQRDLLLHKIADGVIPDDGADIREAPLCRVMQEIAPDTKADLIIQAVIAKADIDGMKGMGAVIQKPFQIA